MECAPESIDALLVTHDHGDHTRGMGVLARRWGIPLYLTERTRRACAQLLNGTRAAPLYGSAEPVIVGDLADRTPSSPSTTPSTRWRSR